MVAMFAVAFLWVLASFFLAGFGEWNLKNLYRYGTAFLLVACILPYIIRIARIPHPGLASFNRRFLRPLHAPLGTVAFAIAILHGFREGRCNLLIQATMLMFGFLLVTGLALYVRSLPRENRRRAFLLHSHRLLVFLFLLLLVLGHLMEEL